MEELSTGAAPAATVFYILITSHNETGGNQVQAGGGEAINNDTGKRGRGKMEESRKRSGEVSAFINKRDCRSERLQFPRQ